MRSSSWNSLLVLFFFFSIYQSMYNDITTSVCLREDLFLFYNFVDRLFSPFFDLIIWNSYTQAQTTTLQEIQKRENMRMACLIYTEEENLCKLQFLLWDLVLCKNEQDEWSCISFHLNAFFLFSKAFPIFYQSFFMDSLPMFNSDTP